MSRLQQLLWFIPLLILIEMPAANGMYDPHLGRFCSRDPIGHEGSKWNLFSYCNGLPLLFVDPSGTDVFYPSPVTNYPSEKELEPKRGDGVIDRDGCSCKPVEGDRQRPTSAKTGKAPPKPGISVAECEVGEKVIVRYTSSCMAGKKTLWCKLPCESSVCFEYVCYKCVPRGNFLPDFHPEIKTKWAKCDKNDPYETRTSKCQL